MFLNKYEAIGNRELTQEEKENSCWSKGSFSGSQIKRVVLEPTLLFEEWTSGIKPHFSNAVKHKMRNGNDWESKIIEVFEKQYREDNQDPNFKIHVDKRTFKSLSNENCYANIDGFLSKTGKIEDSYCGIEIKTTGIAISTANIQQELYDFIRLNYIWQIRYYMWFFNVPKWTVIIARDFFNVYSFTFDYEEEIEYIQHMLSVIDEMRVCWTTKVVPYWSHLPPAKDIPTEVIDVSSTMYGQYAPVIDRYIQLNTQEKIIEAEKKTLKSNILYAFATADILSYEELKQYKIVNDNIPKLSISYSKKRDSYLPLDRVLTIINEKNNLSYVANDFLDVSEEFKYTTTIRVLKGDK